MIDSVGNPTFWKPSLSDKADDPAIEKQHDLVEDAATLGIGTAL